MRNVVQVAVLALVLVFSMGTVQAEGLEEEAKRQLQLAKEDFANGAFDRAINGATSALRLDPTQREAFMIKGLALEQLDRDKEALAMLAAYQSLSSGLGPDPVADEAVARLEKKLEVRVSPVPAVMLMSGSFLAAGGFGVMAAGFDQVDERTNYEFGEHLGDPAAYKSAYALNIGGFITGIVGSSFAVAGLVSSIAQAAKVRSVTKVDVARRAPEVLPSFGAGPGGVSVGLTGRW